MFRLVFQENAAAITVLDLEAQGTLPTKGEKARLFYLRLSPEEVCINTLIHKLLCIDMCTSIYH